MLPVKFTDRDHRMLMSSYTDMEKNLSPGDVFETPNGNQYLVEGNGQYVQRGKR